MSVSPEQLHCDTPVQAEGWPALAPPNMPGPMLGGNFFAGSSSSPQPGTGMVPPTLPANGALQGEAPRYEGQLVSHIMQVQASCSLALSTNFLSSVPGFEFLFMAPTLSVSS